MDIKFFLTGILLLAFGIFFVYGYFVYPEYFLWAGLGGIVAFLSPFIAVLLGIGLIYGSFSKEEVLPPPSTSVVVDDWIVEEALDKEKTEAEEISHCEKNLNPNEKLLLIVAARGKKSELNRLALTDRRVIFYPKDKFQNGTSFDYDQIDTVKRKQRRLLGHLADITLSAKGETVKFEEVGIEWTDEVINKISEIKKKAAKRARPTAQPPPPSARANKCSL